jgi:hypothetical protein
MHGCDLVFAPEVAEKVKRELRKQLGGTCPCDENQRCPLLPDDLSNLSPCIKTADPFPRGSVLRRAAS